MSRNSTRALRVFPPVSGEVMPWCRWISISPPASLAVFSQPLDESLLVLLGGEEVGVSQRIAIGVPVQSGKRGIGSTPLIQPPLLLVHARVDAARSIRYERRLEVVRHRHNEMKRPRHLSPPCKALP